MKQSAAKTLGVAVLGAAFAAAAGGTATADVTSTLPAPSLDTVSSVLPVQEALTKLPAGAPQSLTGGQSALTSTASTLPGTLQGAVEHVLPADKKAAGTAATAPAPNMIGGLPVGALSAPGLPGLGGLGGLA